MDNRSRSWSWRGCVSALGMALCGLGAAAGIFYAVNKFAMGILLALSILLIGILVLFGALTLLR